MRRYRRGPARELTEGGIFRPGFNAELDEVRDLLGGGKQWIDDFQKREQERTGIKSLKVNFNKNFGYFIEVSHANSDWCRLIISVSKPSPMPSVTSLRT